MDDFKSQSLSMTSGGLYSTLADEGLPYGPRTLLSFIPGRDSFKVRSYLFTKNANRTDVIALIQKSSQNG